MKFDFPVIGSIEILVEDKHLREFTLRQYFNYVTDIDDTRVDFKDSIAYITTNIKFSSLFSCENEIYSRTLAIKKGVISYGNIKIEEKDGNIFIRICGRREKTAKIKDVYYLLNKCKEHAKYHAMFYRVILFPMFILYALVGGYFLIHGSLLSYEGHIFAVTGLDGVGKSTLTTKLCQKGATIFADNFTLYNGKDAVPLLMPLRVSSNLEIEGFSVLYSDKNMKEIAKPNNRKNTVELEKIYQLSISEKFDCKDIYVGRANWVLFMNNAPEICDANRFIGPFLLHNANVDNLSHTIHIDNLKIPKGELDKAVEFIINRFGSEV